MCGISLCTRGALDTWSRGRSTAAFCGMNSMHRGLRPIVAIVVFALDAEAMKGRAGFRSGIRPNHWMPHRDYAITGHLDFLGRDWLRPGEQCRALGTFIVPEQDRSSFVPGFMWKVGEGARIVGGCTLSTVLNEGEVFPDRFEGEGND